MKRRTRAAGAGDVDFVCALDTDGSELLVALSRSQIGLGYVIRSLPDGQWECSCDGFRYRGTCAHTEDAGLWALANRTTTPTTNERTLVA